MVPVGTPEGQYAVYAYTNKGSPLSLRAPDAAGDYELRYLLGSGGYRTLGAGNWLLRALGGPRPDVSVLAAMQSAYEARLTALRDDMARSILENGPESFAGRKVGVLVSDAADAVKDAQVAWQRLGPAVTPEARALDASFREACRRVMDHVRRHQQHSGRRQRPTAVGA